MAEFELDYRKLSRGNDPENVKGRADAFDAKNNWANESNSILEAVKGGDSAPWLATSKLRPRNLMLYMGLLNGAPDNVAAGAQYDQLMQQYQRALDRSGQK